MKIDLKKLHLHHWFEDEEGNVYEALSDNLPKNKNCFYYHSIFPCTYSENIDTYTYHPEYLHENNSFYQAMLHFKWFRKLMKRKMQKRGDSLTFRHCFSMNTSYGGTGQECIVAMVNSGDYTLEEAIYVYSNACERCMNVLLYKYLNGKDGYPEHSEEWKKCNTVCDWCKGE